MGREREGEANSELGMRHLVSENSSLAFRFARVSFRIGACDTCSALHTCVLQFFRVSVRIYTCVGRCSALNTFIPAKRTVGRCMRIRQLSMCVNSLSPNVVGRC